MPQSWLGDVCTLIIVVIADQRTTHGLREHWLVSMLARNAWPWKYANPYRALANLFKCGPC